MFFIIKYFNPSGDVYDGSTLRERKMGMGYCGIKYIFFRFMSLGVYKNTIGISVFRTIIPKDIMWKLDPSYYHIIFYMDGLH